MTGKSDIGGMSDFPSHLSQPSRSENVPIFDRGTRCRFAPENHDFGANPGEEKGNSQPHRASRRLPAVLPPVGRCVASWGGGGVRIPPSLFGRVLGSFSVRRKRSRRKGRRRGRPRPGHFCPQCGQLRGFQGVPKWGQNRRGAITSAVVIPESLHPQEKSRGHAPERSSF